MLWLQNNQWFMMMCIITVTVHNNTVQVVQRYKITQGYRQRKKEYKERKTDVYI